MKKLVGALSLLGALETATIASDSKILFNDGFENGLGNWNISSPMPGSGFPWNLYSLAPISGSLSLLGDPQSPFVPGTSISTQIPVMQGGGDIQISFDYDMRSFNDNFNHLDVYASGHTISLTPLYTSANKNIEGQGHMALTIPAGSIEDVLNLKFDASSVDDNTLRYVVIDNISVVQNVPEPNSLYIYGLASLGALAMQYYSNKRKRN